MDGWWLTNPVYIRYIIREATSVFVGIYAFILLFGLLRLSSGEAAWDNWLASMTSPGAIVFHLVALAAAVYHTITWFAVAPKVMPALVIGGEKVSEPTLVIAQYVIAAVVYLVLLGLILWG
jgi:fumarate reductase subunit C